MTTLVTGAGGTIGRAVLDQLLLAGEDVRASVRRPASAHLPAGVPVVAADLTRPETLPAALDGVAAAFLYALPDGVRNVVAAARRAGVEHVVVLSSGSVLLPGAVGNAIAEEHRLVERALAGSGLRWTPIRPLVLAGNALNWSYPIRADGVVRLVHPEARTAPIHERDIAAVAVAALAGAGDPAVSGLLTGAEALSQRAQVEVIAREIGRPIEVRELSADEGRAHLGRFVPAETAHAIVDLLAADPVVTTTAEAVLGHPPASFAQWVHEHADDFR